MSSGGSSAQQQPFSSPQPAHVPATIAQAASPPTKQNLKNWWKGFSKAAARPSEKAGNYTTFCSSSNSFMSVPAMIKICRSVIKSRKRKKYCKPMINPSRKERLVSVFIEGPFNETLAAEGAPIAAHRGLESLVRSSLETRLRPQSFPDVGFGDSSNCLGDVGNQPMLSEDGMQDEDAGENKRFSGAFGLLFDPKSCGYIEISKNHRTTPSGIDVAKVGSRSLRNISSFFLSFKSKPVIHAIKIGASTKAKKLTEVKETGIFGVALRTSITYANVAISLVDAEGKSYIYGYVPIVVAKCGVYLKEKATNVEGIFRLSGSEKRIKELKTIFDSPDRYGKGLDWAGYTVHDAANVLRRYLNQLPEPIVPLDLYDRFREPLRGHVMQAAGDQEGPQFQENFDVGKAIVTYQQLITELPPLNRQLLLYILDLLAVFASKADENRMNSQNLAAIFQPGMLSHPQHDMAPGEYRLSQDVLIFLIENQDHFLIGMRGTAADEQTVQDVQNGTPPPGTPTTPSRSRTTVARSGSNGSAGAESIRKFGGVRRNMSTSSRHSRQSNGAPSPASPVYGTSSTQSPSGGVHRSNTVPSKRSPALPAGRMQRHGGSPVPPSPGQTVPRNLSPSAASASRSASASSPGLPLTAVGASSLGGSSAAAVSMTSQDPLLSELHPEIATPTRERNISGLFQRSPTGDSEKKQPNKLRKKRIPVSSNPSAQSSTHSLASGSPAVQPVLPTSDVVEQPRLENTEATPRLENTDATPPAVGTAQAEEFPVKSRPEDVQHSSDQTLKLPTSPSASLRSKSSFNDQSDADQMDEAAAAERREKRSRWRMSRRKDDSATLGNTLSPKKGSDNGAGASTSSIGSSSRPRKSFTGDTVPVGSESTLTGAHLQSSNDSGLLSEEKKGPLGWLKGKIDKRREEKEARDERNKSPPAASDRASNQSTSTLPSRGKSMEVKRDEPVPEKILEEPEPTPQPSESQA
ncbi:hypothetical protein BP5796_09063 [Coleophoma crateriformis]|uniref:Rho-GAP domain-containing protein n=1 Tax=Coleophoma crateriformis TaxID=565419 RepID=A0A3D8R352_9HELO|nr:hypothetical protein BP5796_09063 [Coleophoma crateriformis]